MAQCPYCKKKTNEETVNGFGECPKCAGKTMFKIMGKKSVFPDDKRPKKKKTVFRAGKRLKPSNPELLEDE